MKFLLVPLGIAAFALFVLVLGALALLISMTVITAVGRVWRLLAGGSKRNRG